MTVDTTVQPKNVTHPTDAKLMLKAIEQLGALAKRHGVALRQSYRQVAKRAALMAGRYTHAKQFKRANRKLRFLRTRLGRHTLAGVIEETEALTGCGIKRAYVDKGYRGHDVPQPRRVFISGQKRGVHGVIHRRIDCNSSSSEMNMASLLTQVRDGPRPVTPRILADAVPAPDFRRAALAPRQSRDRLNSARASGTSPARPSGRAYRCTRRRPDDA